MILRSPTTGQRLVADTTHSLSDGHGGRWPVVEGVPYLRIGREALVADVLEHLDAGDTAGALVELLRDADDWWDEPPPDRADLHALLRARATISLREAMTALGFGRVGDYFAHRWTDPTFLAGLGLIQAHWTAPTTAFELACGIGHYLDVLQQQGVAVTGVDVVFAKLWLARHFVLGPFARLVCCDAAAPWPIASERFDLVLCQDAFYFLEPKPDVLARLRAAVAPDGVLLVGHVHNRDASNPSAGAALSPAEAKSLFPQAVTYDDAELTRAVAEGRRPSARPFADLATADAFAFAEGPAAAGGAEAFASSPASLRRNPLYTEGDRGWTVTWPSERYRDDYAALATYPLHDTSAEPTPETIRRRVFVALPERW